jgi:hypothetical protein
VDGPDDADFEEELDPRIVADRLETPLSEWIVVAPKDLRRRAASAARRATQEGRHGAADGDDDTRVMIPPSSKTYGRNATAWCDQVMAVVNDALDHPASQSSSVRDRRGSADVNGGGAGYPRSAR